jgi:hypothetical protein
LLLTVSSVRDTFKSQSVDFDRLPFQQRFSTAIRSIILPAEVFMSVFRHDDPASLVTAVHGSGTTALHWAATQLREWAMRTLGEHWWGNCSDEIESYQRLVIELIRMGADLHAIHQVKTNVFSPVYPKSVRADPFVSFLRGLGNNDFDQKNVASAVRLWGQTITESGYSLKDYVDAENLYLADLHYIYTHTRYQHYFPVSVTVSDNSLLQTKLVNINYTKIWRAHPMEIPGAWPVQLGLPDIITWYPAMEDIKDGFRWVRMKVLKLESTPRTAELAEEVTVVYPVTDEIRKARTTWFNGTQDDHGPLAMMAGGESKYNSPAYRQHVQRRSASAPPPGSFEHVVKSRFESWVSSVNKCPFDGRWGRCGADPLKRMEVWRWCMRGDLHNTSKVETDGPYAVFWHNTWESSFLRDVDHDTGIAERFAKRFCPERLHVVQATIRRAE